MSSEFFNFTYQGYSRAPKNFNLFSEDVYAFGVENCPNEPYHYSSYEIYEANKDTQNYKFISYVNMTSSMGVGHFPQYMYEAILKTALEDEDFEFKVRSTPVPLTQEIKYRVATSDAGTIVFFIGVTYSILITVTTSYLVAERASMLKHLQVISGMRLFSYWISNFLIDALRFYLTTTVTILLMLYYNYEMSTAYVLLLVFPFAILPFTYVMSFAFTVESAAQTFSMFIHFTVITVIGVLIYVMRVAFQLQHIGDMLNWVFKVIPTYSIPCVFYFETSGRQLSMIRETIQGTGDYVDPDPWHISNNLGDIILMGVHFVFWTFMLYLIEMNLFKNCKAAMSRCCLFLCCKRVPAALDFNDDDDVRAEQQRIEKNEGNYHIRVNKLRKVYTTGSGFCCPGNFFTAIEDLSFGL